MVDLERWEEMMKDSQEKAIIHEAQVAEGQSVTGELARLNASVCGVGMVLTRLVNVLEEMNNSGLRVIKYP